MRSDARKRLHPEPLSHPEPSVRELIAAARAEGFSDGVKWALSAAESDERAAAEMTE